MRCGGGKPPDSSQRYRLVRIEQEADGGLVGEGLRVGGEALDEGGLVVERENRNQRTDLMVERKGIARQVREQRLHEHTVGLLSRLAEKICCDHPSHQRARPVADVDLQLGEQPAEENQGARMNLVAPGGLVDLLANRFQRFARFGVAAVRVDPRAFQRIREFGHVLALSRLKGHEPIDHLLEGFLLERQFVSEEAPKHGHVHAGEQRVERTGAALLSGRLSLHGKLSHRSLRIAKISPLTVRRPRAPGHPGRASDAPPSTADFADVSSAPSRA